jgi:hypothetical protein
MRARTVRARPRSWARDAAAGLALSTYERSNRRGCCGSASPAAASCGRARARGCVVWESASPAAASRAHDLGRARTVLARDVEIQSGRGDRSRAASPKGSRTARCGTARGRGVGRARAPPVSRTRAFPCLVGLWVPETLAPGFRKFWPLRIAIRRAGTVDLADEWSRRGQGMTAKLVGVSKRSARRLAAEEPVASFDTEAEREKRGIGRPANAEPFRSLLARRARGRAVGARQEQGLRGREQRALRARERAHPQTQPNLGARAFSTPAARERDHTSAARSSAARSSRTFRTGGG